MNLSIAVVMAVLAAHQGAAPRPALPGEVIREVSAQRLGVDVEKLASFGTRHTLSDTESPTRGIGAARRWIKSELEGYGGSLQVAFEEFEAPPSQRLPDGAKLVNVIATLPGTMPEAAKRVYYVVGHYDSRNGDAMDGVGDAPGANDDGSGTALVMEVARVLADRPLESTVVFMCSAAEEQGLIGAKYRADQAVAQEAQVGGVLSNDIVGDPYGARERSSEGADSPRWCVRVFSEGLPRNPSAEELARIRSLGAESDGAGRQLARYVAEVAGWEKTRVQPMLVFRLDRFLRGGDHSAFSERGFPAVRFTVPYEDYSRQHVNVTERDGKPYGDVPEFVDAEYLADVTRLNAAALVHLANAPSVPAKVRVITAALATNTTLRWEKSPEPDVAGYEVVWRATTAATWEHSKDVGDATEVTLEESKDNVFFGVRAYDKDGYKSPVGFAGAAAQ